MRLLRLDDLMTSYTNARPGAGLLVVDLDLGTIRQVQIPKAGKPGEFRTFGIPTIYNRVCQQAQSVRADL
jgi:hypothetical protein